MEQIEERSELLAETAHWTVVRCAHGGLCVQLGGTVLNFAPNEFHRFVTLVGEAYVRLVVRSAIFEYVER